MDLEIRGNTLVSGTESEGKGGQTGSSMEAEAMAFAPFLNETLGEITWQDATSHRYQHGRPQNKPGGTARQDRAES